MKTKFIKNLILALLLISFFLPILPVKAGLAEDLEAVQKKLASIRQQKNNIQNQINNDSKTASNLTNQIIKLKNQISLLDKQIEEKELVIQELDLQISILKTNIDETEKEIKIAEKEIKKLEDETDQRMIDIYITEKTRLSIDMFLNANGTDFLKYNAYQNSYQNETRKLLNELNRQKDALNEKKGSLEANRKQVVEDQMRLDSEKTALVTSKSQLDQQRAAFNQKRSESLARIETNKDAIEIFTEEEQKTLAMQYKIEQELFNSMANLTNGVYVEKGTIIGLQGYSGYVIPKGPGGAHLHLGAKVNNASVNPCSLLPAGKFSNCAGNGRISWPLKGTFYFTSAYGMRWGKFHDAIDIASPTTHAPIYAAHSGWMYRGGSFASGYWRKICESKDCRTGIYTFYLHLKD